MTSDNMTPMDPESPKLSRKMESAIVALLVEPTIGAAAQKVGVNEKTVDRWLADERFAAAYREARRKCFDDAMAKLQSASTEAVQTLRAALTDTSASIRIRAATTILELGIKAVEIVELEKRIAELEELEHGGINETKNARGTGFSSSKERAF